MKKLFVFFVIVMLAFALNAKTAIPIQEKSHIQDFDPNNNNHYSGSFSREIWDLQFSIDVDTPSGLEAIAGAETDGTYVYGAKWSGSEIVKFDLQGNYIETFTIPGVTGLRDLAYDGTYFYGSNASAYIWEMDFDTHTLISTITTPNSVRSIAYDSDLDGFWYNDFATDLEFVDRTGALQNTILTPPSLYGCAYDNYTAGGPYLWIFTGTLVGGGCQVEQYDLNTLTLTGETHSVDGDLGVGEYFAGGLFLESDMIAGKITLGGLGQGVPDLLFGYEIGNSAPFDAPGAPTDVAVIPDAGGALQADITWTCPTTTVGGATLTDLDEIRVLRDWVLIYTDFSPTIGGVGSYTDSAVPASDNYTYRVFGVNSDGEGLQTSVTVWVGEDVPNVVESLLLVDQGGNGYLTWDNPTTGLNGGAFNNDVIGYHIERSDSVLFEIAGMTTEYTDISVPAPNYYSYTVTPYNTIGDGGAATTDLVWLGDAFSGIVIVDLDSTPTGSTLQAAIQNNYTGTVALADDVYAYPFTTDVDAVFVLLGVFNNNHALTEEEGTLLAAYLDNGGNVYMEGGDTWAYNTATSVHPYFNINGLLDGDSDLANVTGHDFLDGMSWSYSGENNWIDHLEPIAPAVTLFSNIDIGYNCGVAHDAGTYKTVGTSFEITGLGGTNTLDEAVAGIIEFFDFSVPLAVPTNLAVVSNPDEDFATFTWDAPATGDITGYDVYLDDDLQGNTTELEWIFTDLVNGQIYNAGIVAVYDEGSSEMVTVEFTYDGTGVGNSVPLVTALQGNYPNPFNPETKISFSVAQTSALVTIDVYNLKGQKVKTLVDENLSAGPHSVIWNGTDDAQKLVSSGVYFYKMKAGKYQETKKMILMK